MPIRPGETRQPANSAFWTQWRADKQAMKDAGWRVDREPDGTWSVWRRTESKPDTEPSRAVASDFHVPLPPGLSLYPYQRAGIEYAVSRPSVLIADEMGLGKTVQALGVVNADPSIRRVWVVCPASLKINWCREAEKWLTRAFRIVRVDSTGLTEVSGGLEGVFAVVNYDILHRIDAEKILGGPCDLLIADEAHYAKTPTTRRSKALYAIKARRRILLTGTPILSRPIEIQPLLEYLDPAAWGGKGAKFRFARRYCAAKQISVPGRGPVWDFSGASNLDELQSKLRSSIMVRRLKRDVLTDLPPKVRSIVPLPVNGALDVIDAENDLSDRLDADEGEARAEVRFLEADPDADPAEYQRAVDRLRQAQKTRFECMAKVRHDTAVAKVPACLDWLDDALESVPKIVVFAHHHDVIDRLSEHYGAAAVVVTGDTPIAKRQAAVDRFQTDASCRVFLGNLQAAGVGITLTAASTVAFCETDWVPATLNQCEDRLHRIGQVGSVAVYHLVFDGSLDARMLKTVMAKQSVADAALDDRTERPTAGPTEPPSMPDVATQPPSASKSRRDDLDAIAARLTPEQRAAAHAAVCTLQAYCDGARSVDGMGFSKIDVALGRKLAGLASVSPRQAALCWIMARKYRRQLDENTVRKLNLAQVVDTVG